MSRAVVARSVPLPRARRAQHGQGRDHQAPAFGPGDGNRVEVEAAPLRVLAAGVECAQQGAAGERLLGGNDERLAPPGADQLRDELAEVWLLDLLEPASAIFRWKLPRVW